jgi:hypothetical protein
VTHALESLNASSTVVREAFAQDDKDVLHRLVHPDVVKYHVAHDIDYNVITTMKGKTDGDADFATVASRAILASGLCVTADNYDLLQSSCGSGVVSMIWVLFLFAPFYLSTTSLDQCIPCDVAKLEKFVLSR